MTNYWVLAATICNGGDSPPTKLYKHKPPSASTCKRFVPSEFDTMSCIPANSARAQQSLSVFLLYGLACASETPPGSEVQTLESVLFPITTTEQNLSLHRHSLHYTTHTHLFSIQLLHYVSLFIDEGSGFLLSCIF